MQINIHECVHVSVPAVNLVTSESFINLHKYIYISEHSGKRPSDPIKLAVGIFICIYTLMREI